jgi:hypothetical protein
VLITLVASADRQRAQLLWHPFVALVLLRQGAVS